MFFILLTVGLILVLGALAIVIWQMQLVYKFLVIGLSVTMALLYILILVATATL